MTVIESRDLLGHFGEYMSKYGLQVAIKYGEKLPSFSGMEDAKECLFAFRDEHLALLEKITKQQSVFTPDYQPVSLKQLEGWYFKLYETNSFHLLGTNREVFESCMAMYFGEIAVRRGKAQWIVQEYFLDKRKFQLGINNGLMKMMLERFTDHYNTPNNKRRQSLFRLYDRFFSS